MGKKVVASWNRGQTNFTKENNPHWLKSKVKGHKGKI